MATNPKKTTTDAAATGTRAYTVKYVVNHDGEEYGIGSKIDLTDKQAAPLLAVDAIGAPSATADDEAA
jgi:hypothetical protein